MFECSYNFLSFYLSPFTFEECFVYVSHQAELLTVEKRRGSFEKISLERTAHRVMKGLVGNMDRLHICKTPLMLCCDITLMESCHLNEWPRQILLHFCTPCKRPIL